MFQDEARFRTASATAVIVGHRVYCDPPSRRCPRTSMSTRTPPLVMDGGVGSLVLPAVNGGYMGVSGNEVASRHALENIILVFDGAGWHHGSMKLAPQPQVALLATVFTRAQSGRATLGAPSRRTLPQPRVRRPGCPGRSPGQCITRIGARPQHRTEHYSVALDY